MRKDFIFISLFLWFISSLLFVFSFRPLFQHHLVFLAIPAVLFFSNNISSTNVSINQLIDTRMMVLLVIAVLSFITNFYGLIKRQNTRFIQERDLAKNLILENTDNNDVIITDEAALYGMTGRLPPPELVDLSYVQIRSGNISSKKFKSAIKKYRPKMIITWNGRLKMMDGLQEILLDYNKIDLSKEKIIYVKEN